MEDSVALSLSNLTQTIREQNNNQLSEIKSQTEKNSSDNQDILGSLDGVEDSLSPRGELAKVLNSIYNILEQQLNFEKSVESTKELTQQLQPKDYQQENFQNITKETASKEISSGGFGLLDFLGLSKMVDILKGSLLRIGPAITTVINTLMSFAKNPAFLLITTAITAIVSALNFASEKLGGSGIAPGLGGFFPTTPSDDFKGPMSQEEFEQVRIPKTAGGEASRKPAYSGRNINVPTTSKSRDKLMGQTYNAFVNAGFSENQAKSLVAEVGRENAFKEETMFGYHSDPYNKATNVGMFSWQGKRGQELQKKLEERGLLKDGKMVRGQESLNEMAKFAKEEMESKSEYSRTKKQFLENPNIGSEDAAEVLGKNYVRWRYDDPRYASGHKNRKYFLSQMERIQKENPTTNNPETNLAENKNSEPSTWSKFKTWATKPVWGEGSEDPKKTATKESEIPEGGKYSEEESEMEEADEPILTEEGQQKKLTEESSGTFGGEYTDYFQQMISLLSTISENIGGDGNKNEDEEDEDDEEEETSETAKREDQVKEESQLTSQKEYTIPQQQATSPNLVNLGVTPMTQQSINPMGALQDALSSAQQGLMIGQMFGNMGMGGMGGIGGAMSGIGMAGSAIGSAGSILGTLGQSSPMLSDSGNTIGNVMGTLGNASGIMSNIQGIQNMGIGGIGGMGGMGGMGVAQGVLGMGQSILGSVQGLGQGIGNAFGGLFGPTQSKVGTIVDGKPVYGEDQINKSIENNIKQNQNVDEQVKQISEIDRKMNDPNQSIDTRSDQQRVTEGIDAVAKAQRELEASPNKVGQSLTDPSSSIGAGSDMAAINAKYSMAGESSSIGNKLESLSKSVQSTKEEIMIPPEQSPVVVQGGGGSGASGPGGGAQQAASNPPSSGTMGIDVGVRNEEPTLLKAQYGSIRVV